MHLIFILLAALGLAVNVLTWSVPAFVAASGAIQFAQANDGPSLIERLNAHRPANTRPSIPDALVNVLGAELEAIQVAGVAIEHPTTPRLAERADQAGAHVLEAVRVYVAVVEATVSP